VASIASPDNDQLVVLVDTRLLERVFPSRGDGMLSVLGEVVFVEDTTGLRPRVVCALEESVNFELYKAMVLRRRARLLE
jgi:hypothetical protein